MSIPPILNVQINIQEKPGHKFVFDDETGTFVSKPKASGFCPCGAGVEGRAENLRAWRKLSEVIQKSYKDVDLEKYGKFIGNDADLTPRRFQSIVTLLSQKHELVTQGGPVVFNAGSQIPAKS